MCQIIFTSVALVDMAGEEASTSLLAARFLVGSPSQRARGMPAPWVVPGRCQLHLLSAAFCLLSYSDYSNVHSSPSDGQGSET